MRKDENRWWEEIFSGPEFWGECHVDCLSYLIRASLQVQRTYSTVMKHNLCINPYYVKYKIQNQSYAWRYTNNASLRHACDSKRHIHGHTGQVKISTTTGCKTTTTCGYRNRTDTERRTHGYGQIRHYVQEMETGYETVWCGMLRKRKWEWMEIETQCTRGTGKKKKKTRREKKQKKNIKARNRSERKEKKYYTLSDIVEKGIPRRHQLVYQSNITGRWK